MSRTLLSVLQIILETVTGNNLIMIKVMCSGNRLRRWLGKITLSDKVLS